jgi:MoaA/NifB/PqqE/SkfB family radical SAM enzyme
VQTDLLNKHELSFEKIKSIIDDAYQHNVFLLILSGGEPLLHSGFSEIIEYARSKSILPLLGITGIKVCDQHIKKIADLRIPTVQVSIDGANADTNDRIRGFGNFDEVLNTIIRFQKAGIKVNVAICLHRQNSKGLEEFFYLMLKNGVARIKLAFYKSFTEAQTDQFQMLSLEETALSLEVARNFMEKHNLHNDWIGCPSHDVWTGTEWCGGHSHPPLMIGANGVLLAGEGGEFIGHLDDGVVSESYTKFVEQKITLFLDKLIQKCAEKYGVANIRTRLEKSCMRESSG